MLLHAAASRTVASGLGDFSYGCLSFAFSGAFNWASLPRFVLAILLAAVVFASFMMILQSLAFWIGTTSYIGGIGLTAMLTFAIYPISLFDAGSRLILFTLIPAALMGAVPAGFVRSFGWATLVQLLVGAGVLLAIAVGVFYTGLKRYESGSGIQVEV